MDAKYALVALSLMAVIAVAGCISSSPSVSPTISPSVVQAPIASVTPTPTPVPTPMPLPTSISTTVPTPLPVYQDGAPVAATNIKISWDTAAYLGPAEEFVSMTVVNELNNSVLTDVEVDYSASTPTVIVNPDGTKYNSTATASASDFLGLMEPSEQRNITFQVDHSLNMPVTVSITLKWNGGSAQVLEQTLNMPASQSGTFQF